MNAPECREKEREKKEKREERKREIGFSSWREVVIVFFVMSEKLMILYVFYE